MLDVTFHTVLRGRNLPTVKAGRSKWPISTSCTFPQLDQVRRRKRAMSWAFHGAWWQTHFKLPTSCLTDALFSTQLLPMDYEWNARDWSTPSWSQSLRPPNRRLRCTEASNTKSFLGFRCPMRRSWFYYSVPDISREVYKFRSRESGVWGICRSACHQGAIVYSLSFSHSG